MVRSFGDRRYPTVFRLSLAPRTRAFATMVNLADPRLEADLRMTAERREFGDVDRLPRGAPLSASPGQRQNALFRAGQGRKCVTSQALSPLPVWCLSRDQGAGDGGTTTYADPLAQIASAGALLRQLRRGGGRQRQ